MTTSMRRLLSLLLLCTLTAPAIVAQTCETDTMAKALRQALEHNFSQLQRQAVPAYFMSLRMADEQRVSIQSVLGAASVAEHHQRTVTPQVRIGSMMMDNYKFVNQGTSNPKGRDAQGAAIPVTGKPISAIREAIWKETQARYEIALKNYAAAQGRMMTAAANEDGAPCFSSAPVSHYYEPPLPATACQIDRETWKKRLNEVTTVFKESGCLEEGNASITFTTLRTWFVNSEGSMVVQNRQTARVMLTAAIKANDGMHCPIHQDFFAFTAEGLPDTEVLKTAARDLTRRLIALRDAPVADPYSGPAILSGAASGVFFHEIFGHRLEGHRLKTGGETFKKKVGERVLPASFHVYCDPTLSRYGTTVLNGHYRYDDEGVKARRVDNVVNGVLRNFLMSRVPLDGFPESNGHGRTRDGNDPVSRQSNLIVETAEPYTEAQLRGMLISEAKRQGKEYGYYFRTVTSGFTLTGEGNSLNSFNVSPVEVYRVFTDGRPDQLVRGVDLIGTPLSMFGNIVAAGDTPATFTGECGAESGWVPVTATSPMIFVSQIETQRSKAQRQLPSILPAPQVHNSLTAQSTDDEAQIIVQAMSDEMARTRTMKLNPLAEPYFIDYRIARVRQSYIRSVLGGTVVRTHNPIRTIGSVNLLLGDSCLTSEVRSGQATQLTLADEVGYDDIRLQLWKATDAMYKYAAGSLSSKHNYLAQHPRNQQEARVPEMLTAPATTNMAPSVFNRENLDDPWQTLADHLSAVFADYPHLYGTQVSIERTQGDAYRLTNDPICLRQPIGYTIVEATASTRCADGSELTDRWHHVWDANAPLPDEAALMASLKKFAEKMTAKREADVANEYYCGPVLYEDEAVASTFASSVANPILIASRTIEEGSGKNSMMLGKRIIDPRLCIAQLGSTHSYNGTPLIGCYKTDADGRHPEKLELVANGILRHILCGRHPAMGCETSTGNERFLDRIGQGLFTHAAAGAIRVYASKTQRQSGMRKALARESRKAGLDYAYIVRATDGGMPALYRYDCQTGKETPVRAKEVPLAVKTELMHLTAISGEETVTHLMMNDNRLSMVCPKSIIVESIEFNFEPPVPSSPFAVSLPAKAD